MTFENRVTIDAPVEDVYAFLADPANLPRWNYYVLETRPESPGPPKVGATYRQRRKTDVMRLVIAELAPGRAVTLETVPPGPALRMRFTLSPTEGGGTEIVDAWDYRPGGAQGFLARLGAGRIQSAVRDNLEKLKELLETGRTVLQDGRVSTL